METRLLTIWDVDEHGKPAEKYRKQYCGDYFERYKSPTEAMKVKYPEWKEFRIGVIRDDGTGRVAVFRQLVKSRNDYRPTDILMGRGGPKSGEDVLEAGSTDPRYADPPGQDAPCNVCDFNEREPTEEDKRDLADSRRGPPTETDRQRWCEKEKANQRRAEAEEAVIRLAAKAYVEPPAKTADKKTSKALSEKRAKAAKGNRTVKDKYDRGVIKAAVLRKIKQGYTSNQAHNEVADRCRDNQNLLKLKNGPYSFISARSVRRIVMNK